MILHISDDFVRAHVIKLTLDLYYFPISTFCWNFVLLVGFLYTIFYALALFTTLDNIIGTVKPVLTTTSEQQLPIKKDRPESYYDETTMKLLLCFEVTSEQQPPSEQRPLFGGPKGGRCLVTWFDCMLKVFYLLISNLLF